jgi:hypothetical protein
MTGQTRAHVLRSCGRLRLPPDLKTPTKTNSVAHFYLSPPVQFRMSLNRCESVPVPPTCSAKSAPFGGSAVRPPQRGFPCAHGRSPGVRYCCPDRAIFFPDRTRKVPCSVRREFEPHAVENITENRPR